MPVGRNTHGRQELERCLGKRGLLKRIWLPVETKVGQVVTLSVLLLFPLLWGGQGAGKPPHYGFAEGCWAGDHGHVKTEDPTTAVIQCSGRMQQD